MNRSSLIVLALVVALLAGGSVVSAQSPPRDLHVVGDHWTAWNPPTTVPAGSEIYIIERGDTLWDLSTQFYGDPYLWPQLWERNSYILDAHWIYPGDPLVIGFEVTQLEDIAAIEDTTDLAGLEEDPYGTFPGEPVPLGSESDIYCSGYIGEMGELFPHQVVGSEFQSLGPALLKRRFSHTGPFAPSAKVGMAIGDIVYLDGGRVRGLEPGALFSAVRAGRVVTHPDTGKAIGRHYDYLGRLRVLSVQEETGIAEVIHSCHAITLGSFVKPFEPEPVPLGRRTGAWGSNDPLPASELKEAATVVLAHDEIVSIGQHHLVFLDRGEVDDVTPGDLYTVYRIGAPGLPALVLGELAVLSVKENTALARVLDARYTLYVGDRVVPKR